MSDRLSKVKTNLPVESGRTRTRPWACFEKRHDTFEMVIISIQTCSAKDRRLEPR